VVPRALSGHDAGPGTKKGAEQMRSNSMSGSGGGGRAKPWLVAAWPGMGNVAVLAAGHLVRELNMTADRELPPLDHFDTVELSVRDGLILPVERPRGLFFRWHNTAGGRDLVVFLGEAQPTSGSYAYAHELLDAAEPMEIERVVTFASLASVMHPSADAHVVGMATDAQALDELRRAEVTPMDDGQIGGLNGLLLAAAGERGLSGMCLLASIPFFAVNVPNPKAARSALSVFSVLAGIDINLEMLTRQAQAVDRMLAEVFEKLQEQGALGKVMPADEESADADDEAARDEDSDAPGGQAAHHDLAAIQHIEKLFEEARKDQSRAVALKQELDRLGVFSRYEDRFLDLFRRGG